MFLSNKITVPIKHDSYIQKNNHSEKVVHVSRGEVEGDVEEDKESTKSTKSAINRIMKEYNLANPKLDLLLRCRVRKPSVPTVRRICEELTKEGRTVQ